MSLDKAGVKICLLSKVLKYGYLMLHTNRRNAAGVAAGKMKKGPRMTDAFGPDECDQASASICSSRASLLS